MADLKRVFSIGYEFEDARVQNAEFHEPDSSLGHDLIYWDPSQLLDGYTTSLSGSVPLLKGVSARTFEKDRERRAAEFQEHLKAGKPVVIALPPPQWMLTKFGQSDASYWDLGNLLSVLPEDPELNAARGKAFELVADGAFAELWEWTEEVSTYECYFADAPGTPLLRIAGTDKVVATAVPVSSGVVFYLPRLNPVINYQDDENPGSVRVIGENDAHKDFLDLLWSTCRQFGSHGFGRELSLPKWADDLQIPGEKEAIDGRLRAERRLNAAQRAIRKQDQHLSELRERKILVGGTGPSLEKVVDEALSALGFSVEPGLPGRTDRVVRFGRRTGVVEIKGKSKSASERDAAQLEKWKSDFHATHGKVPKGILVVNAWRGKSLADREKLVAFPDQMLNYAAEQRQQCLLTGLQLLGLWLDAEDKPSQKGKLAKSILSCNGIYPDYQNWRDVLNLVSEQQKLEG